MEKVFECSWTSLGSRECPLPAPLPHSTSRSCAHWSHKSEVKKQETPQL